MSKSKSIATAMAVATIGMTLLCLFWKAPSGSHAFSVLPIRLAKSAIGSLKMSSQDDTVSFPPTSQAVNDCKIRLVRLCQQQQSSSSSDQPNIQSQVRELVTELEQTAEQQGIGQGSAVSGLLPGEWKLLHSPEDATRSSPFFWAFRKAFPGNSDQIFGITDAIPAPIKEVGPAWQNIQWNGSQGSLVSRVKVATLGGMATSIMTTRATIVGVEGLDGLRLKIETTKPEESTIVDQLFGPLAAVIKENSPAFPSGEALERIVPGSSEVVMRTTFCDEGLRISRNDDRFDEIFVWQRKAFATFEEL